MDRQKMRSHSKYIIIIDQLPIPNKLLTILWWFNIEQTFKYFKTIKLKQTEYNCVYCRCDLWFKAQHLVHIRTHTLDIFIWYVWAYMSSRMSTYSNIPVTMAHKISNICVIFEPSRMVHLFILSSYILLGWEIDLNVEDWIQNQEKNQIFLERIWRYKNRW